MDEDNFTFFMLAHPISYVVTVKLATLSLRLHIRAREGQELQLHKFLTSVVDSEVGFKHRPCYAQKNAAGTHMELTVVDHEIELVNVCTRTIVF
jgi:hypothetical protein